MVAAKAKKVIKKEDTYDWLHQVAFWGLAVLLFFPRIFAGCFLQQSRRR